MKREVIFCDKCGKEITDYRVVGNMVYVQKKSFDLCDNCMMYYSEHYIRFASELYKRAIDYETDGIQWIEGSANEKHS